MKQRVLIADDNREFIRMMTAFLSHYPEFEIVAEAYNGKEALKKVQEFKPDILLLDIIMPVLDGIAVLEQLQSMHLKKRPYIIALTGLEQDKMIKKITSFDLDYIFIKPFDFAMLIRRMQELGAHGSKKKFTHSQIIANSNLIKARRSDKQSNTAKELQRKISDILQKIGISPSLKGYQYLREIIAVSLKDEGLLKSVTKTLYPMVAEKFGTTATRVERDIRHAIETAWTRGQVEVLHKYFGYTVDGNKGKPTNSEFIAMIIDWIRLKRD